MTENPHKLEISVSTTGNSSQRRQSVLRSGRSWFESKRKEFQIFRINFSFSRQTFLRTFF